MRFNKIHRGYETRVGAIIHYALIPHGRQNEGVMNYGPYQIGDDVEPGYRSH